MLYIHRIKRWLGDMHRNIFKYHDGERTRRADPFVVSQNLEARHPNYAAMLATLSEEESKVPPGPLRESLVEEKKKAVHALIACARDVFDLKPISDSGGCTDAEAVKVITSFFLFMEGLAEEAGPFVK